MKLDTSAPTIVETYTELESCLVLGHTLLSTAIEIEEVHSNLYICTVYIGGPSWRVSMPSQKIQSSGIDLYQLPILTQLFEYQFEIHYKDGRCFGVLTYTGREATNTQFDFDFIATHGSRGNSLNLVSNKLMGFRTIIFLVPVPIIPDDLFTYLITNYVKECWVLSINRCP